MRIIWKQAVLFFLAGALSGAALTVATGRWRWQRFRDGEHRYERLLKHFNRRLNLSPDQRSKVAAILQAKREKLKALRDHVGPRFEEIRAGTNREIRALLNAEQQAKFDKMLERREKWRKKFGGHH